MASTVSSAVSTSPSPCTPIRLIFPEGELMVPAFTTLGPSRKTEPPESVSIVP